MLLFQRSLPAWERGLKFKELGRIWGESCVAPGLGAWIEIPAGTWTALTGYIVAPGLGAWIEIPKNSTTSSIEKVAPGLGAWIEIGISTRAPRCPKRRSRLGSVD